MKKNIRDTGWTKEELRWLRKLYPRTRNEKLVKKFNRTIYAIKSKANKLKIFRAPDFNDHANAVTKREENFIVRNYFKYTRKELCAKTGRGETTIENIRKKHCLKGKENAGRYKKGSVPANKGIKRPPGWSTPGMRKTQFKKGSIPPNKEEIGTISIRVNEKHGTRYKYIKLGNKKWIQLHQHIWVEKFGPIPSGHIVVFKDKNQMNCEIDNLEMITLEQNMERNTFRRFPEELQSTMRTLRKLNRRINNAQTQLNP